MKKSLSMATCTATIAFATAALLAAQTQTTPATTTPSGSENNKVTITGCLRAAPTSPSPDTAGTTGAGTAGTTGTTGTTGAPATAGASEATASYVLTDATMKPAEARGAAGSTTPAETTTGGAAAAAAPGSGQTDRLIANPAALTPHVGRKLELTGTLENASGSSGAPRRYGVPSM
jgi:pilus assembly protein FimV